MNEPRNRISRALGVAALLAALPLGACHREHHVEVEKGHFLATTPLRADTQIDEEYVCQVRASQHIELRSVERGYLQDVFVDEGQFVEKGQRMFQVMPIIYQAELEQAQAEAEFARIEFENTKSLGDQKIVSPQEVALAAAKLNKAKAAVDLAAAHLSLTEIKAPFSGIMDRLHVRRGSLMEEGDLLTSLSDNSQMWVYFNVDERQYLEFRSQHDRNHPLQVRLRMANGELFDHPGLADTIEGEFHNTTGTIAFRATFPNPDKLLRHGQTGSIVVAREFPGAMLVPQKATFDILDRKFVYVLDEERRVRSREIFVKAEKPHVFVIESGLNDGDTFLVEGLRRVREGDEVEVHLEPPSEVFATLNVPAK